MYVLQVIATSIMRYIYIFIFKNPSGRNDDFWCFVYNLVGGFLAFLYQAVFLHVPGKNPYLFYICCNQDPRLHGKAKVNIALQLVLGLSFLVYIFVVSKIHLYRQKHFSSLDDNNRKEKIKRIVPKLVHIALTLIVVYLVGTLSALLNATEPENFFKPLYYNLIQIHHHWIPLLNSIIIVAGSYGSSKKLRQSFGRDLKSMLNRDLTVVQNF